MKTQILLFCLMSSSALAQVADPTRPPAAMLLPPGAMEGGAVDNAAPRLQSVLLPHAGRPVAVISGQTVALGETLNGSRLVKLTEKEAVLQGADGTTHLYLTPDVHKKMIVSPAAGSRSSPGATKGLR